MANTKEKLPNAYQLNPGLMQGLAEITPENLPMLLMTNPELIPEPYRISYLKNLKSLGLWIGGSGALGIVSNVALTRILPRILILPNYFRYPTRIGVFFLPALILSPKIIEAHKTLSDQLENHYIRIQRLRKTGNIEEYFKVSQ